MPSARGADLTSVVSRVGTRLRAEHRAERFLAAHHTIRCRENACTRGTSARDVAGVAVPQIADERPGRQIVDPAIVVEPGANASTELEQSAPLISLHHPTGAARELRACRGWGGRAKERM